MRQKLAEYRNSLNELSEALKADPGNEELQKLQKDLLEVITLTEDLLKKSGSGSEERPPSSHPAPAASSIFPIGSRVFAQFSGDGLWYEAVVDEVRPDGTYLLTYTGYGNSEERPSELVKPKDAKKQEKYGTVFCDRSVSFLFLTWRKGTGRRRRSRSRPSRPAPGSSSWRRAASSRPPVWACPSGRSRFSARPTLRRRRWASPALVRFVREEGRFGWLVADCCSFQASR